MASKKQTKPKPVKVVLLGSVPKGDEAYAAANDWRSGYVMAITAKVPGATFLHNHLLSDSVGPELVVGHDLWLIAHADVVVVNASEKVGAGTAQEMVIAKKFGKPVVCVVPKGTHHRRQDVTFGGVRVRDWIHPFLYVGSDAIVENVAGAAAWIGRYLKSKKHVKGIGAYDAAIKNFEKKLGAVCREYRAQGW